MWKFSGFSYDMAPYSWTNSHARHSHVPSLFLLIPPQSSTFTHASNAWCFEANLKLDFLYQNEKWPKIKDLFVPIESGYSANQRSITSQLYTLRGVLVLGVDSVTSVMKGFSVTVGASSVVVFAYSVMKSVVAGTGPWNSNKVADSHN